MKQLAATLLALLGAGMAVAETAPAPAAAASAARSSEPAVQRTVIEDDNARIEELRVRGQVRRIAVRAKVGGGTSQYEVLTNEASKDPSQDTGAVSRSVWRLFGF
jgi:hypothetical protein